MCWTHPSAGSHSTHKFGFCLEIIILTYINLGENNLTVSEISQLLSYLNFWKIYIMIFCWTVFVFSRFFSTSPVSVSAVVFDYCWAILAGGSYHCYLPVFFRCRTEERPGWRGVSVHPRGASRADLRIFWQDYVSNLGQKTFVSSEDLGSYSQKLL